MTTRSRSPFWVALAMVVTGCAPGPVDLVVDIRTDLVPRVEFDTITVRLDGAPTSVHEVDEASSYVEGRRLAMFEDIAAGSHRLELEVMLGDVVLLRRPLLVQLERSTAVTVVVTRDCVDVTCPGASDAPTATACLGGQCVDEACSVENPDACPEPACSSAADCPMLDACAVATCQAGVCLYADGGTCSTSQYCDPSAGCTSVEPAVLDCSYAPPTGDVYYVAVDGDDGAGDGSEARPWATLTNAITSVPDGSTVLVRPGMYVGLINPSVRFAEGIVVRSELPYRAVLRNTGSVIQVFALSGVTFEGFDMSQDPASPTSNVVHITSGTAGIPLRIVLRNNIIHDSYGGALVRCNDDVNTVSIVGNVFYNSASQQVHIADGPDLIVERNVFFSDLDGAGRATDTSDAFVLSEDNGFGSVRHTIRGNVFLRWQGRSEAGFVEVRRPSQITVENNLMIGGSTIPMRSPFIVRGSSDVVFRHNTVVGSFPDADAFAFHVDDAGRGSVCRDLSFFNNVWSDPGGGMSAFGFAAPAHVETPVIASNLYFNGGAAIPEDAAQALNASDDASATIADPAIGMTSIGPAPTWDGARFADGSTTTCELFESLVRRHGLPAESSPAVGAADSARVLADDILGRPRSRDVVGAAEPP